MLFTAYANACSPTAGRPDAEGARTELVVFAASSLTEAFADIAHAFEGEHPDVDIRPVFAGSQTLRLQLEQGAVADVFASADAEHIAALGAAGLVEGSRVFACNELVVIVPRDDPAAIASFSELDRAHRLVVGSANVPVGAYTRRVLERSAAVYGPDFADRVRARIVSQEANVRLVRAKVELGEADAAIVYRTDAEASDAVRVVAIPAEIGLRAAYPIARVTTSTVPSVADAFVAFVRSQSGLSILERHGFAAECTAG